MALNRHTNPAAQTISELLKTMVIEYIVQRGIQLIRNSTDPDRLGTAISADRRLPVR